MVFVVVAAAAVVAGIIQSATGFGAAVLLMLVMPYFFDLVVAPAATTAITLGLSVMLAWRFRKHIELKICLPPTLIYLAFSLWMINLVKSIDLKLLTLAFGVFLVILAIYFFAFSGRISFQANWKTASICALISGISAGLFGIGGPLMAIYFVSATKKKEAYIGNIQFLFATTNLISLLMRIAKGIYTADLLPVTVLGVLCITLGKGIGLRILDKLDSNKTKKLVYAFVGISGLITVIQQVLG